MSAEMIKILTIVLIFGFVYGKCPKYGDRGIPRSRHRFDVNYFDSNTEEMIDDMIISKKGMKVFFEDTNESHRNGVLDRSLIWKNQTIRYYVDTEYTDDERRKIRDGTKWISDVSCVKFIELSEPPNDDKSYVHINSLDGCFSRVGSDCKKCTLSIAKRGCMQPGTIAHEFLHSLGFYHMQCANGRNSHVKIMWDNIERGVFVNYQEVQSSTLYNTSYDYDSIMHYGEKFFTKNGKPTIVTKNPAYQHKIGQRAFMSEGDIKRLNILYECEEKI